MKLPKITPESILAGRMARLATERATRDHLPMADALRTVAGELRAGEGLMGQIAERNALLAIRADQDARNFARRFPTLGEGMLARIQGVTGTVEGSRGSIDSRVKAIHGEYFGRLVNSMEQEQLLSRFKRADDEFIAKVYDEMGAFSPTVPRRSVTGDNEAFRIASMVDDISQEMVARQNKAGAYINRMPGYVTRQTHDMAAIRELGRTALGRLSKEQSFRAWYDFTMPLIDAERTFQGVAPEEWMRMVHEELYTGKFGAADEGAEISTIGVNSAMSDKVSKQRKIHFKDARSAFTYNQSLGLRNFKEAVMNDIHARARNIALMETFGPNPENNFKVTMERLRQEARSRDDADVQLKSLDDWRIQAAWDEITGKAEVPNNPSLNRIMSNIKVMTQLAKMGGVVLSSFSDRAFLQAELAYQGLSHLTILGKQITSFAPRKDKSHLRLMGVAMDGLIGNALSRYSSHSTTSGVMHTLQKKFFDLNGLNLWTDSSKAAAAELMAAHLGEHITVPYGDLPGDLAKVLSLYDISRFDWEALRTIGYAHGDDGTHFITPDRVRNIAPEHIVRILAERGERPNPVSIAREYAELETKLRMYISDRVDHAVPTPGAAERKYATFGVQAGTPLGEAIRMIMLFKSFPITIMNKVVSRNVYGNGAKSVGQWLLHDHKGKMNLALLMAMGTALGYLSGAVRDGLKGRAPKPLITDDGEINTAALNDAAIRGGSLGILGDQLFSQYDRGYKSFSQQMLGPVLGQADELMRIKTSIQTGKFNDAVSPAGKLAMDNTPFINLFYLRPVLDYLILWNLEEIMDPGALGRMESAVQRKNKQDFWLRPSEVVNR